MIDERTSLEDQPVGRAQKQFSVSEYPEGQEPVQNQNEQVEVPLKLRMRSKLLKHRHTAYDEILKKLSNNNEIVEITTADFVQFISESHSAAQEKGMSITKIYVERKINVFNDIDAKEIIKAITEKALVQNKEIVKRMGMDIVILLFEMGQKQIIQETVISFALQKNPKIVCAAIQLVIELLTQFGIMKMEFLKHYWKFMEQLSQSQQSAIKNEAVNFYKQSGKWMGKSLETHLQTLQKDKQDEIMKFILNLPEAQMKPLRGSQDETIGITQNQNNYDPYENADPIDVFLTFQDQWCEKVKSSQKWSDKKVLLDNLLKAVQVPKIAPNSQNLNSIVQMLKGLVINTNQPIQLMALKILGQIALSLRKNFTQGCKVVLFNVLQKLKDSKTIIIEQVILVVKNFFFSINLDDMMDDFRELLEDKAPGTRVNTLNIIEYSIDSQNKQALLKLQCTKTLPSYLTQFIEDGSLEVRDKAFILLSKIQGKIYEGSLKKEFAQLKPDKVNKINLLSKQFMEQNKENKQQINTDLQQSNIQPKTIQNKQQLKPSQQTQKPPMIQMQNPVPLSVQLQQKQHQIQMAMHDELPKQSVFQNKDQRIQLEIKNPFPISNLSDQHIEILKQMFLIPGVPQTLYQNLFSLNQNQNLRAIRYISQTINKASEISDILFKWAFTIGWLRESFNLQSEILQLFNFILSQFRKENYEIHPTELRVVKGYIIMLGYLLCKTQQQVFAQRIIPIIMDIFKNSVSLLQSINSGHLDFRLEDEELNNNQELISSTKVFIAQMGLVINDWSKTDALKNRLITQGLIFYVTNQKNNVQKKIQIEPQDITKFNVKEDMESVINQNHSNQITQNAGNQEMSETRKKVAEQFKQFQILTRVVLSSDTQMKNQGENLVDLCHTIAIAVFQIRDNNIIVEFCNDFSLILTSQELFKSIPYPKFLTLIYWLFNQILKELSLKDDSNKISLNSVMLKVLGGCDITNLYLSLLDIILKERQNNQNQQMLQQQVQLSTRCLNKVLQYVKNRLSPSSLLMILERFNDYLSRFCQFPDGCPPDNLRKGDDIIAKALKTALLQLTNVNELKEISQILDQLQICPQSHLRRWITEQLLNDDKILKHNQNPNYNPASQRYSYLRHQIHGEQSQIRVITDLININDDNFDKGLEQLVIYMKRNKGFEWKSHIIQKHPKFSQIEEKITQECTDSHFILEKKIEQLTSMNETMKQ